MVVSEESKRESEEIEDRKFEYVLEVVKAILCLFYCFKLISSFFCYFSFMT